MRVWTALKYRLRVWGVIQWRRLFKGMPAPTFEEHIAILATESPSALIQDWWLRLDRGVREHFALVHGRQAKDHLELEQHIAEYPNLGPTVSAQIASLRRRRNEVVHGDITSPSPDAAKSYARQVFGVIDQLLRAWHERQEA